jgi:predicted transcriptional regulator of viral defense system
MVERGLLTRIDKGIYALPDADFGESQTLAEAAVRVPQGVVCLLTAIRFHEIGMQDPFEIWMAIDNKAHRPRISYPPLRIVRFSGEAFAAGVEAHVIEGVTVRIYSAAKTVADCFKYRNKVGLDVALEALRECLRQRKSTVDEIWRYAKICRVNNVMRPYLEAMV